MTDETKNVLPVAAAGPDDEMEVNLAEMFAYILRRWMSIVVVGLVCAVAAAAFSYVSSLSGASSDYSDEAYAELAEELTAAEIEEVESVYAQYQSYRQQIALYDNKYSYTYLLTLVPSDAVTLVVEYAFTSDYPGTVSSFSSQALGMDEYVQIAQLLGIEDESYYRTVSSLLSIYGSDSDNTYELNSYEIDVEGEGSTQTGIVSTSHTGKLYFEVLGTNIETCEQIADIVREALERHLEELQAAGIEITLSEVSSNQVESGDSTVLSAYQSMVNNVASLKETLYDFVEDYVDEMESDQIELYEFLVARDSAGEAAQTRISMKMPILGLIGAVIVMVLIYAVMYLLDGSIKDADEAAGIAGRPVLGILRVQKPYKGLNGLFDRWADLCSYGNQNYPLEGQKRLVEEQIAAYAEKCGAQEVFVIADPADEKMGALLDEMEAGEALQGLKLRRGNPCADGGDFAALKESGMAVLTARLMGTPRKSAVSNVGICRELGIEIAGVVIVGEM